MKSTTFILPKDAFAGIASSIILLSIATAFVAPLANAAVVEHTFEVRNMTLSKLCKEMTILAVNDQYPGPTIDVTEGDTVVVHVINKSPQALSIHWHGVFQMLSNWADGAGMVTQCLIQPGNNLTYRFTVSGQEGTLWWHAHVGILRMTVHGALIIRPKNDKGYPFPKPDGESTIILGEWWEVTPSDLEEEYRHGKFNADFSKAITLNGKPGNKYPCSSGAEDTYTLQVEAGKSYLLRLINTGLITEFFYKITNHTFKVVAIDACYTNPFETDLIVIGPGQTIDAILVANAPAAHYYIATTTHSTFTLGPGQALVPNMTIKHPARGMLKYAHASLSQRPVMPVMPKSRDHLIPHNFYSSLTGLLQPRVERSVPLQVDNRMFITVGIGYMCSNGQTWCEVEDRFLLSHMNNISFQLPKNMSMLEAHYNRVDGIYNTDFPDEPPLFYNFTNPTLQFDSTSGDYDFINKTSKGTKVRKLKYNTTVELIIQSLAVVIDNRHHMHLHGHNFYVLASGFGNYEAENATQQYNLIDPPMMNTVPIPLEGWAVIRFVANNPGVWLFHCHMDMHFTIGMAMAFVVEDGPTQDTSLPPPPADLPKCSSYGAMDIDGAPLIMDN